MPVARSGSLRLCTPRPRLHLVQIDSEQRWQPGPSTVLRPQWPLVARSSRNLPQIPTRRPRVTWDTTPIHVVLYCHSTISSTGPLASPILRAGTTQWQTDR